MKIPKQRTDYLLTLYLPILAAGIFIAIWLGKYFLLASQSIMLILLLGAIVLAISPLGKHTLPVFAPAPKKISWIMQLICLQLGVYLLFYLLIYNAPAPINFMLYAPWPLILLMAILFARFAAEKKSAPLIDSSFRPIFKNKLNSILGSGIDIFIKQALFFSCALTISGAILIIIQIFRYWLHLPDLYQPQFNHLPLSTLLIIALSMPLWRNFLYDRWRRGLTLPQFLLIFSALLLAALLCFNLLLKLFHIMLPNLHPEAPGIEISLQNFSTYLLPQPLNWQLLSFCWWIGLAPLLALFTARIMQGKTIRLVILTGLIIPVLMVLAGQIIHFNIGILSLLFAILSILIVSLLFEDRLITRLLISAGSGKNEGRIAITSVTALLYFIAMILIVYLLSGINLILLIFFGFAATNFLFLLIMCSGYFLKSKLGKHVP